MKRYLIIIEGYTSEETINKINELVDVENIRIINYELLPSTSKTKILVFYEKINNNDIDF